MGMQQDGSDLIWIGEPKLEAAKKLQRQPEGRGGTCVEESSNQKNVGWQNQHSHVRTMLTKRKIAKKTQM